MDASANEGEGFAGRLSDSQALALSELRGCLGVRLAHPRWTDALLLRFLRAKQFDARAAAELLEGHLAFREQHGLDGPAWGNPRGLGPAIRAFPEMPIMRRFYPHAFHKTDRLGRPLYIERLGQLDVPGLVAEVTPERILEYFAYESERSTTHRLPACSLAHGALIESTMSILDLDGLGFRTLSSTTVLKMVRSIMKEQNENFPEVTGRLVIVNAPGAFSILWSAIKGLLSASTAEKIEVFRAGNADYQARLRELVAPENLPVFFGGTCTCEGFEGGCMCSDAGPWSDPDIERTLEETPHWEVLRRLTPGFRADDTEAGSVQLEAGSRAPAEVAAGSASTAGLDAQPLAAAMEGEHLASAEASGSEGAPLPGTELRATASGTTPTAISQDEQLASAEVLGGSTGLAVPDTEAPAASDEAWSASAKVAASGAADATPCDEESNVAPGEGSWASAQAAVLGPESVSVLEATCMATMAGDEEAASDGTVQNRIHGSVELNSTEVTGDSAVSETSLAVACEAGEQDDTSGGVESTQSKDSSLVAEPPSDHVIAGSNNHDSNAIGNLIAVATQPKAVDCNSGESVHEAPELDMASVAGHNGGTLDNAIPNSFCMGGTGDEAPGSSAAPASQHRPDDPPIACPADLTNHLSDGVDATPGDEVKGNFPEEGVNKHNLLAGASDGASDKVSSNLDVSSSPTDQSSMVSPHMLIKRWILGDSCLSTQTSSAMGLSGTLQSDPGSLQPLVQGRPCPAPEGAGPHLGASEPMLDGAISQAPRDLGHGDADADCSAPGAGRAGIAGTAQADGYENRYSRENVVRWLSESTFRAIGPLLTCGPRNL